MLFIYQNVADFFSVDSMVWPPLLMFFYQAALIQQLQVKTELWRCTSQRAEEMMRLLKFFWIIIGKEFQELMLTLKMTREKLRCIWPAEKVTGKFVRSS